MLKKTHSEETRDAESRSRKPVADLALAWTPRREKLR
ncbi:BnaA07g36040D [Brassica napus]|uniref:BnaA07g36040D protein n=1 Tax=Brassica napus TaxID=3708 RepID=A0A078IM69_BRANA|nr:BnaA07g36040D [Brassica napus]